MTTKTYEERIAEIEAKENRLKQQKKKLKAEQSKKARNARTKRLIEIGAAVESVLGHSIEKEDLPKLIAFLSQQEERGEYFSRAMNTSAPSRNT